MTPEEDINGNFGKFFLEVSSVLQCFEEMSAKICLRTTEPDAVLKRAISGLRGSRGTFGKQRTL